MKTERTSERVVSVVSSSIAEWISCVETRATLIKHRKLNIRRHSSSYSARGCRSVDLHARAHSPAPARAHTHIFFQTDIKDNISGYIQIHIRVCIPASLDARMLTFEWYNNINRCLYIFLLLIFTLYKSHELLKIECYWSKLY